MHPEKFTDWYGFSAGDIISPYFFEKDVGKAVTVNGECCWSMITNFFSPELDDAIYHTAHATLDILCEQFEGMVLRGGDVNWPLRSCDLNPLDFFL